VTTDRRFLRAFRFARIRHRDGDTAVPGSGRDEAWFRSPRWDDASRAEFEARLARARPANRIQYRRIKALALLDAGDGASELAASELLVANLAEPDLLQHERVVALVVLAGRDQAHGRLAEAEGRLRSALDLVGPDGSGTTGEEEIALAEVLLAKGGEADVHEAMRLLDRRASSPPPFVRSRYRLVVARARAHLALGEQREASAAAAEALRLAAVDESGMAYHPRVGLVAAPEHELAWLRALAGVQ
jgi:hypothetical protein